MVAMIVAVVIAVRVVFLRFEQRCVKTSPLWFPDFVSDTWTSSSTVTNTRGPFGGDRRSLRRLLFVRRFLVLGT